MESPGGDRGYIGLSFSGGGYRATAFSLGAMALLHDLALLGKARVMSSVSGGSLALGAYLCAKAGANPSEEADFHFYERFWMPLMQALTTEELARAFVRLPSLLEGEKLILRAADDTQRFFNQLLNQGSGQESGQEANLGNPAFSNMLHNRLLSPDYVFFNTTNISSLDLFRFGIQRGREAERDDPVYVLNRYFLQAKGGTDKANDLYPHAQRLRLADCVAASFAFPGGFEPLIFPDDYFRCAASEEEKLSMQAACSEFRQSLICDRRPYVAFLDGGLYDNLGLASVEDIRHFLARRSQDLELRQRFHPAGAETQEREQPIHYVIATDVDNIQPGIGFYGESSLDRRFAAETPAPDEGPARRRALPWLLLPLASAGILTLLGFILGVFAGWLASAHGLPAALLALGLAVLIAMLAKGGLLGLVRSRLEAIDLKKNLGLSNRFDPGREALNLWSIVSRLLSDSVRRPRASSSLAVLKSVVWERRFGQLLPAFNGYLKRTRSLTYGYLQKSYQPAHGRPEEAQRCHLIRNMIFELMAGPDLDPSFAADLITLPIREYRHQDDGKERAKADASIATKPPIMRKLRHAAYVEDLLFAIERQHNGSSQAPVPSRPMDLALELLQPRRAAERDEDLWRSCHDLQLFRAACRWSWLTRKLCMDDCDLSLPSSLHDDLPDPVLLSLVEDVRTMLRKAEEQARKQDDGKGRMDLLRGRCAIDFGEEAGSYSWIPLICEMATNLSTTLWVEGYRWYEPNQLEDQRIIGIGQWHATKPNPKRGDGVLPLLDLGLGNRKAPAAAITALAGYLITCFNLLDFLYSCLGASLPLRMQLTKVLQHHPVAEWDEGRLRQLADLPFALREAVLRDLRISNRLAPGDPLSGLLALLEPWLTCRDGYPERA